jgi:predicted Zn-dependent protease
MGGSGGSYLSPPSEKLGSTVASPLLTVIAHRKPPTVMAAKWDDDGVAPTEFTLIRDGKLASYAMSRRTATLMPGSQGLNGCAVADKADDPVVVRLPHVVVAPSSSRTSIRDLYKDIHHGIFVYDSTSNYISVDSMLASGVMSPGAVMFEIRNGELVTRLRRNSIQFSTPQLWKSLEALGDTSTAVTGVWGMGKGLPRTDFQHSANAPAARFKQLDVINTEAW